MLWRRYRTSIFIAVTFSLLLSTFWFFPTLAFIIFISLLLQLLLDPIVDRLSAKLPRGLSAALVLIAFIFILGSLLAVISQSLIPTATQFAKDLPEISEEIRNLTYFRDSEFLSSEFDDITKELTNFGVYALQSSVSIALSLFNKIIDFVIIIFVTFYLLTDGEEIKIFFASLFPRTDYSRIMNLFNSILRGLRIYVCAQLTICCITAFVVFIYFTLMGIKYASVFALLSGTCEFIPVLGPTIASAFGVIMTATQTPWLIFQTICFYLILTQTNHNIIYPSLIGKSLNIHPVAIILGVIFGGEILGPAGMFLAVPFIVIIKLVIADIYHDRVEEFRRHAIAMKHARKKEREASSESDSTNSPS